LWHIIMNKLYKLTLTAIIKIHRWDLWSADG